MYLKSYQKQWESKKSGSSRPNVKSGGFCDYEQRTYDFDLLEKQLLGQAYWSVMFGYPSWFRNRSILFLSKFDKSFYNVSKISFKSQVKLGRFYVDFILEINNSKIIVECDGKDYHDPDKDKERDKVLTIEGDLGGELGR